MFFYAMEDSGILNVDNPVHMFTLHCVFLARINQALHEYKEAFNNHGIRTASGWSPYQLWLNGMMHEDNPLAKGVHYTTRRDSLGKGDNPRVQDGCAEVF